MSEVVISGTGYYIPKYKITNDEIVNSFNTHVRNYNKNNPDKEPLSESSADFIIKASGIKNRYVIEKEGILDPSRMKPHFPIRSDEEMSLQCEMAVEAAKAALAQAKRSPEDVDCLIISCSAFQRNYPAISTEVQKFLGTKGFAFDMSIACSSGIFGIFNAYNCVKSGHAKVALVLTPEINSGHIDFKDRETHFIFGDAAGAVVIEKKETAISDNLFEILGLKLFTTFSNNIRSNFGYLNRCEDNEGGRDKLCIQKGRRVFKEVVPVAVSLINEHLIEMNIPVEKIKRFWLHQANGPMNQLILKYLLGRDSNQEEAPLILDEYANTSSAGVIIAFNKYQSGFLPGDLGLISAFGAGYSAGCMTVRKT